MIERAQAGMVCPAGDGAALVQLPSNAWQRCRPRARERMGAQGQAYARAEFDRSTQVGRLLSLLEEARQLHCPSGAGKVGA